MVSTRCKMAVKEELDKLGLHSIVAELGEAEVFENISTEQREKLRIGLQRYGLELMDDKRAILIEKIKTTIIDLIHHSDELIKVNLSTWPIYSQKYKEPPLSIL